MPGLVDSLERLFKTKDLYEILGLPSDSKSSLSGAQIKKAYHKKSLVYHPDRVAKEENRPEATEKFQCLGAVYKILSDPDRKALYDESGEIDDESDASLQQDTDWDSYWRALFKKITLKDIAKFESEYRESAEEYADLKQAYIDGEGDMNYILDNVLCCTLEDEDRFSNQIKDWIEDGEVERYDKFSKESAKSKKARKRKMEGEAAEAEEMAAEMGLTKDEDSLTKAIMARQAQREAQSDNFLDQLAAKYGNGDKGKKKGGSKKK